MTPLTAAREHVPSVEEALLDLVDLVERELADESDDSPQAAVGISTVLDSVHSGVRGLEEGRRGAFSCVAGKAVYAEHEWFGIALSRPCDSVRDSLLVDDPLGSSTTDCSRASTCGTPSQRGPRPRAIRASRRTACACT